MHLHHHVMPNIQRRYRNKDNIRGAVHCHCHLNLRLPRLRRRDRHSQSLLWSWACKFFPFVGLMRIRYYAWTQMMLIRKRRSIYIPLLSLNLRRLSLRPSAARHPIDDRIRHWSAVVVAFWSLLRRWLLRERWLALGRHAQQRVLLGYIS